MNCYICDGIFLSNLKEYQSESGYKVCSKCVKEYLPKPKEPVIILNTMGQIVSDASDSDTNEIILEPEFDFGQGN